MRCSKCKRDNLDVKVGGSIYYTIWAKCTHCKKEYRGEGDTLKEALENLRGREEWEKPKKKSG